MPVAVLATVTGVIRVLILDDHELVARGLGSLLELDPRISVVGCAPDLPSALVLAQAARPDVALVDYRLGAIDGVEAGRRLRDVSPTTALVMITASPEHAAVSGALEAGFSSLVLKTTSADELVHAVVTAAEGDAHFSTEVISALVRAQRESHGVTREDLTSREDEILRLLAEARSTVEIAAHLHLSTHTVRNHVRNLMAKLDAHTKLEALVIAAKLGIIDVGRRP